MLCLFCVDKIEYTTTECIDVVIRILTLPLSRSLLFLSWVCLIFYWYCKEKFCLQCLDISFWYCMYKHVIDTKCYECYYMNWCWFLFLHFQIGAKICKRTVSAGKYQFMLITLCELAQQSFNMVKVKYWFDAKHHQKV